jgi:hypothetical protein
MADQISSRPSPSRFAWQSFDARSHCSMKVFITAGSQPLNQSPCAE